MTAKIIQIRDFQNKRDLERLYGETTLEQQAIEIMNVALIENLPFPPWPCEAEELYIREDDTA